MFRFDSYNSCLGCLKYYVDEFHHLSNTMLYVCIICYIYVYVMYNIHLYESWKNLMPMPKNFQSINYNYTATLHAYFCHQVCVKQHPNCIGESLTTNRVIQISSNNYYSFRFRVPQVVTLTYNLSVEVKQVDVDATKSTILGTIYPDSDDQTICKSVELQSGQHFLFAYIV